MTQERCVYAAGLLAEAEVSYDSFAFGFRGFAREVVRGPVFHCPGIKKFNGFFNVSVTMPAIEAQAVNVTFVAEGNRLLEGKVDSCRVLLRLCRRKNC